MKRLTIRVSVLAAVLLVGGFAIAYAQRDGESEGQSQDSGSSTITLGQPRPQPQVVTPVAGSNPLRQTSSLGDPRETTRSGGSAGQAALPPLDGPAFATSAAPPRTTPTANESAAAAPDPFGIHAGAAPPSAAATVEPNGPGGPAPAQMQMPDGSTANNGGQSPPTPRSSVPPDAAATRPDASQPDSSAPNRFEGASSATPLPNYGGWPNSSIRNESIPPANPPADPPATTSSAPSTDYGLGGSVPSAGLALSDGTGRPAGDRKLDGQQTPQLTIQKVAPAEIQVGKPATFRVEVKNTGPVVAENVEIRDEIPRGTRLVDTKPSATRGTRGELVWTIDKIEPGGGASVEIQLMPTEEGEIGSVATVSFRTAASVRTRATKPELVVDVTGPKSIMIDGVMTLSINVSNPGSGVATGVVLEEHVPPCLQHPAGAELEYEVGDLAPNETKTLELKLTAVRPGQAENLLVARAEAVADVTQRLPIEVVAPELKLEMAGPRSRYLERQATYELAVSNAGTAPARDVRIEAELPRGLKFVSANNNAHYDPQTNVVQWALAELPAGERGTVQLITMPVEIGQHTFQLRGAADRAIAVKEETHVTVDGIAAMSFEVIDAQDPIEVGGETTYEIRVLNQGSKEVTQVRLVAAVAPGLQIVAAEGPDNLAHQAQGNQLVFEPLTRLSPKVDVTYRLRVRGSQPGDQRVHVELSAAELQTPVVKEESTRVFSDK